MFTVPKANAGYDWVGNLAFGLNKVGQSNCQRASFAFYGSTCSVVGGNQNHLYKAIPDDLGTFSCLSSGGFSPAWGGMAIDTADDVWAVSQHGEHGGSTGCPDRSDHARLSVEHARRGRRRSQRRQM